MWCVSSAAWKVCLLIHFDTVSRYIVTRHNAAGQLGLGDNATRGLRPSDMGAALPFVDLGPGLMATALAAGSRHTCVLLQPRGRVKCWG